VSDHQLAVVGRAEYIALPHWGIKRLRAKVDTGACNSALHVENIAELEDGRVRFDVLLNRKTGRRVSVEAKIARQALVRPSSGIAQKRIFVRTKIKLGGVIRSVEISLVDRRNMLFRMLLGRSALENRFLVDVGQRYLWDPRNRSARANP
jgi:hypothetical protein